jgi:hypothetical protein
VGEAEQLQQEILEAAQANENKAQGNLKESKVLLEEVAKMKSNVAQQKQKQS